MITVKTDVRPSKIGGLGIFAIEPILKGTLVWQNFTDSELILTETEFNAFSDYMKGVFRMHGYLDKKTNEWKLPLDNSRFFNHSSHPNTYQDKDGNSVALMNIEIDEEISVNYGDFDGSERDFKF